MPNFALTMNQCKRAADLYRAGYSIDQIADYFGRSHMAVRNALKLLGVQMRPRVEARKQRIEGLPA
jgi:predicted DNA-binding protein YlxM (UPF0122 family)